MLSLILSDVVGSPLDVIASGPTAPDPTTFADAREVLVRRGLAGRVPASIPRRLEAGLRGEIEETPKPGDRLFDRVTNIVIGNNGLITDAAVATADRLGYRPHFATRELQGEAREVARDFVARALNNFLWVTFTRSNPAADIEGIDSRIDEKHWGCRGPLVIDARLKPHMPPPLEEDPAVSKRVDELAKRGGPLHGIV